MKKKRLNRPAGRAKRFTMLIPRTDDLKTRLKRLHRFKPLDLRALYREATSAPDKETDIWVRVILALRKKTKKQMNELVEVLGCHADDPDVWERAFFWFAFLHYGVGHLAYYPKRSNRNAAKWTQEDDLLLLSKIVQLTAKGRSQRAAFTMLASDRDFIARLPYKEHEGMRIGRIPAQTIKARKSALRQRYQAMMRKPSLDELFAAKPDPIGTLLFDLDYPDFLPRLAKNKTAKS